MPRLVSISDTHSQHSKIKLPDGDMLLYSGDATWKGTIEEVAQFCTWLEKLIKGKKYKDIVFTPGNHDFLFETNSSLGRRMIEDTGAIYLEHEEKTIQGLRVFGSPYTPFFFDWAFNVSRGPEIRALWDLIPAGIDILITHGPPYGILDQVMRDSSHVGCVDLLAALERIKPKVHQFGHIHEEYGVRELMGIKFINASTCTLGYKPTNAPIVTDL